MRAALALCLACALLASGRAQPAPGACPGLLTLVRQMPDSGLFADVLEALGATDGTVTPEEPLPPGFARRLAAEVGQVPCPRNIAWVCSTDGVEYANACVAGNAGAKIVCDGRCPCPGSKPSGPAVPCPLNIAYVCSTAGVEFDNSCLAGAAGAEVACDGRCPCPGGLPTGQVPCPRNIAYVCSTDGVEYANACVAGNAGAKIACDGRCPCPGSKPSGPAVPCPLNIAYVCSTAGVKFDNACVAGAAGAKIACDGLCPCASDSVRAAAAPSVDEPFACPAILDPVCGTDGRDYSNSCVAAASKADVACKGACPCSGGGGEPPAACIDIVDPVCGADGANYTNSCFAQVAGTAVQCLGECPCPDLVQLLESGAGGVLLVPTDDALLAELAELNATASGDWMSTTSVLEQLLARHVLLAEHQNGLSGAQPVPTPEGTPAVTEAGQRIELFSANAAAAARVVTLGARPDTIPINGTRRGCNVELYGVDGVLLGPDPPAAA